MGAKCRNIAKSSRLTGGLHFLGCCVISAADRPMCSDGHDKPFCTKAITIIDNFKKALGDTDNR